MSKIQFESKSQLYLINYLLKKACKQLCQRYNLKANHNLIKSTEFEAEPVSNYVKDTI